MPSGKTGVQSKSGSKSPNSYKASSIKCPALTPRPFLFFCSSERIADKTAIASIIQKEAAKHRDFNTHTKS